ncbi:MAG: universal stress protein [Chloroflexi bacterium]|nr:universal stress protein [Chloroflexota bacterium]
MMYNKILAPLDGSELSECSLKHVKAIASGCHVPEVVVIRVIEPVRTELYGEGSLELLRKAEKDAQAEVAGYLNGVADTLKKEGVAAKGVSVQGRPSEEILDYARKNHVDLIVMSTHGRSGVSRWVMGSVADRVVRHSVAPVMIVSPPGCRSS